MRQLRPHALALLAIAACSSAPSPAPSPSDGTDSSALVDDASSPTGDSAAIDDASADALPTTTDSTTDSTIDAPATGGRDWGTFPAIATLPSPGETYALSDVHGGYDRLVALLHEWGLIATVPSSPGAVSWSGGHNVLVVVGDLIDKGPKPVEVIDVLRALQTSAATAGGRVVVTIGNHEAEFLVDPSNAKATATDGIDVELGTLGIAPATLASEGDPRGAWLRGLPFGARVGAFFFSHAGNTQGKSVAELEAIFHAAVDAHHYDDPAVIGADSMLEAKDWTLSDPTIGATYAKAVDALHLVFGHQPSGLGPKGSIAVGQGGALFRIDCGMSPGVDYSAGALLRVKHATTEDVVEELKADGTTVREIWRGATTP